MLTNFYSPPNITTEIAFKIPGAKPGSVPHPGCVCFGSCYAVPQEALCCLSLRDPSPQVLSLSRSAAEPILPLLSMPAGAVSPGWNELLRGSSAVTHAVWGFVLG